MSAATLFPGLPFGVVEAVARQMEAGIQGFGQGVRYLAP